MQSQMGSGHYGSRGSQHNPQMPDQQQVQNVMNAHRSNPAAGNVMNSKDGRQGGQNQSSLHANENQQRGPKHVSFSLFFLTILKRWALFSIAESG